MFYDSDHHQIISLSIDRIKIWDELTRECLATSVGGLSSCWRKKYLKHKQKFLYRKDFTFMANEMSPCGEGMLHAVELQSTHIVHEFVCKQDTQIKDFLVLPNSKRIVTGNYSSRVQLWDENFSQIKAESIVHEWNEVSNLTYLKFTKKILSTASNEVFIKDFGESLYEDFDLIIKKDHQIYLLFTILAGFSSKKTDNSTLNKVAEELPKIFVKEFRVRNIYFSLGRNLRRFMAVKLAELEVIKPIYKIKS